MSYRRDLVITSSQQQILHHVTHATGPSPGDKVPDSYARWSTDDYTPWVHIEVALSSTDPTTSSSAPAPTADDDEEEEDEYGESERSDEESSKESDA